MDFLRLARADDPQGGDKSRYRRPCRAIPLSLARLVPSSATLYAGIGNLGAEATAAAKISQALGASKSSSDPLQSLFGISSSNPVLQHPAALVVLGGPGATTSLPGEALYLVDPNASAAQTLLQQFASSHHLTLQPMTVAGTNATGIYAGIRCHGALSAAGGLQILLELCRVK